MITTVPPIEIRLVRVTVQQFAEPAGVGEGAGDLENGTVVACGPSPFPGHGQQPGEPRQAAGPGHRQLLPVRFEYGGPAGVGPVRPAQPSAASTGRPG
ncbi:hypothetical protein J1792_31840 [Streptomyces triculaminicus]|uniref:Uncharacterized protein n=2 Tax=Streptomyces TaxID=1883 RepID=A0A939JS07_9ACTN|nr:MULTISPECIES: hypothetical protein [Streptomyces]MBO0657148.1 hypothetical protein [Streptomyces triculaminicus]QSY49461.1 hypothetical protein J3S04_31915 [Streptomyces griseocarneus]